MYFESVMFPTADPTKSNLASETEGFYSKQKTPQTHGWVKQRKRHLLKSILKSDWIAMIPSIHYVLTTGQEVF